MRSGIFGWTQPRHRRRQTATQDHAHRSLREFPRRLLLPRRLRGAVTDIYRFARARTISPTKGLPATPNGNSSWRPFAPSCTASAPSRAPRPPRRSGAGADLRPLAATIARHQLPITPFYDLLSAFEQDIAVTRYQDYASLLDYCTRSANPVGRLMLHLFHAASPQNLEQSDAICTGLQLVNFWQDVRLDWHKHRVYLPQEDLRRHGVSEEDLAAARLTPAWRELMAFQVERTRTLLHFGAPLARRLPGRIGLELRMVVQGGLRVLERIEAGGYDVFMNRPELGAKDWAIMLWRSIK